MRLDAIFLQTRIFAEFVCCRMQHFEQVDDQLLALGVGHNPVVTIVGDGVGSVHPVERLIRAAVGMNGNATIGFHHDEANRFGEMSREAPVVINGAASDNKTHEIARLGQRPTWSRMRFWMRSRRACRSR